MINNTYLTLHSPDVLDCLANLSNDEVFTPPKVVNQMLDLLPDELWTDPNATFLDPASKSGVFLREIAKRLLVGLAPKIPDLQERIDHIYQKQLFGIAITELTDLLSKRSLYCTKYPSGPYSVSMFSKDRPNGNLFYENIAHSWKDGRCTFCGASQAEYDRDPDLESHAYAFIHTDKPEEIFKMRFDVIIGNPPYQLSTGGAGRQARPIYPLFIEQAKKLNPRYLSMITPSRWLAGGMGLSDYRKEMLNDRRISSITDYSLSTDCFPGVDIAGGVSYFLWERDFDGECFYTYYDGGNVTSEYRILNEFDVFIRNNNALSIVRKVVAREEPSCSELMSSLGPFGLSTAERGLSKPLKDSLVLLSSAGRSFIERKKIPTGHEYIRKWKVIIGKATSAGAATAGKDGLRKVIATLDLLEPDAVCTFSYFIGGAFETQFEAKNCLSYYSTKFVRFLLLQSLSSIDITKDKFRFVPVQDFSKPWNDEELYAKYGLSQEEIDFIESMIKPMDLDEIEA